MPKGIIASLIASLDQVAQDLEDRGMIHLATSLDAVANSLEMPSKAVNVLEGASEVEIKEAVRLLLESLKNHPHESFRTVADSMLRNPEGPLSYDGSLRYAVSGAKGAVIGALLTLMATMYTNVDEAARRGVDGVMADLRHGFLQATGGVFDITPYMSDIAKPRGPEDMKGEGIARRIADSFNLEYLGDHIKDSKTPARTVLEKGLTPVLNGMNIKHDEIERVRDLTVTEILRRIN